MTRENPQHLAWIRKQPCAVCDKMGCEPHHWRTATNAGTSLRPPDEMTIPLCFNHHTGNEGVHNKGKFTWTHKYFPDSEPWGEMADQYVMKEIIFPLLQFRIREMQENHTELRADIETVKLDNERLKE